MNNIVAFLAVMCVAVMGCSGEEAALQEAKVSDFRVGQVWKYKTRLGEEASRLVICRIEPNEKFGPIIHIHVEGIAIKSPASPDGIRRVIGHMPFAQEDLRESVVAVEETRQKLPEYEDGYNTWKKAFDNGNAGIFTISVADGVDFVEQAMNR